MAAESLFRQNPRVLLHWRALEDDFVVFDQLSGTTYRFDVLRAFVLDVLAQSVRSEASLISLVMRHLVVPDVSPVPELVLDILNQLQCAGLVEVAEA